MKNRHGQMDQDLWVKDLVDALDTAIDLLKRQAQRHYNPRLEEEVDIFLYKIERE